EEGTKYGNIEIPYLDNRAQVENIQARTVSADGQSTDFNGTIFDRIVVKSKRFRVNVKAFTLPNVHAGSIIEYSYRLHQHKSPPDVFKNPQGYVIDGTYAYPAAQWTIQRELFVRQAHFLFHPFAKTTQVTMRSIHLPKMAEPQREPDGSMVIDIENIPAFQEEEYSPPEDVMRGRVEL